MNAISSRLSGLFLNQQPSEDIQSFNSALKAFKASALHLQSLAEPLKIVEEAFCQKVRLKHPRDIYPIYKAVTVITDKVAQNSLKDSWNQVLNTLQNRRIYRIGLGSEIFDVSAAKRILNEGLKKEQIEIQWIDLKNEKDREAVVDYIYRTDREAFGSWFQKIFLHELLRSSDVRCITAKNDDGKIVGILWGFLSLIENNKIFHIWELSRKAPMANMGIAERLWDHVRQWFETEKVEFATLNVDRNNQHAHELYKKKQFEALAGQEISAAKIFMFNKISHADVSLKPELPQFIVKNFVMKSVALPKLIWSELVRRIELIGRAVLYR